MLKKNDLVQMKIEDITSEGLGIGHAEGMAVFVKDTVIGDEITAKIVKEKKTYAFGRLEKLLVPSPDRAGRSASYVRRSSCMSSIFMALRIAGWLISSTEDTRSI